MAGDLFGVIWLAVIVLIVVVAIAKAHGQ